MWCQATARFIPACAGNTTYRNAGSTVEAVHPRVCGEHAGSLTALVAVSGSSPRVRGTHPRSAQPARPHRFIPACAGNTMVLPEQVPPTSVHPRVCGEHVRPNPDKSGRYGSSPRVRGTPRNPRTLRAQYRFIPACAGNTAECQSRQGSNPVHPRVCGEHNRMAPNPPPSTGSSPRVRGTRLGGWRHRRPSRFIPACAGNTKACRRIGTPTPVHPRVCGEHSTRSRANAVPNGSSPRVRGTHLELERHFLARRFIPACAGNTDRARPRAPGDTVHPRVCGEHTRSRWLWMTAAGSSPRVRGTQGVRI